jgi:hypothetical protein
MIREGGTGLSMAMPDNIWEKITNKINNLVTNDKVK